MTAFHRRYRVLVDVDVRLGPIDAIAAGNDWRLLMRPSPEPFDALGITQHEYITCQQRLLDGLLRDDATLDLWLKDEVNMVVTGGNVYQFQGDRLANEILEPVIPVLPAPDRKYFEDMIRRDRFYEAAESLLHASTANVVSMTIEGILFHQRNHIQLHVDQRYRASIDVDAEIGEINSSIASMDLETIRVFHQVELGVSMPEFADHQCQLRNALLRNDDVLDEWLRDQVFMEIANLEDTHLCAHTPLAVRLQPVIDRMSPDDQSYLSRAAASQYLYEALESFHEALSSEIVSVTMIPMSQVHADA